MMDLFLICKAETQAQKVGISMVRWDVQNANKRVHLALGVEHTAWDDGEIH